MRSLYENSVVPVREIARLAGVTERTIYKYARKQNWKPRYRSRPDGARPSFDADRARFAPVKGAGGRYIARDAAGKPVARGIKATDPSAAARAGDACERAQVFSTQAEWEAHHRYILRERNRAFARVNRAMDKLQAYREEKAIKKLKEIQGPFYRARNKEERQRQIDQQIWESRNDIDALEEAFALCVVFETDALEALKIPEWPDAPPQGEDSGTS